MLCAPCSCPSPVSGWKRSRSARGCPGTTHQEALGSRSCSNREPEPAPEVGPRPVAALGFSRTRLSAIIQRVPKLEAGSGAGAEPGHLAAAAGGEGTGEAGVDGVRHGRKTPARRRFRAVRGETIRRRDTIVSLYLLLTWKLRLDGHLSVIFFT